MESSATVNRSDTAKQFAAYPFDSDPAYQEGLASILASPSFASQSNEEKAQLILRSRVFYFNQVSGADLTFEDLALLESSSASSTSQIPSGPSSQHPAPSSQTQEGHRVLSFAELKELIEQGRTDEIPNNEKISDALHDSAPSASNAAVPKKPWERSGNTTNE